MPFPSPPWRFGDLRHTEMQNVGLSCLNRFPITARSAGLGGLRLVPTESRHPYHIIALRTQNRRHDGMGGGTTAKGSDGWFGPHLVR